MSVPWSCCQLDNHRHSTLSSSPVSAPVVRIGAVRVRLSAVPTSVAHSSAGGGECCCGVPWPSRSRIPLPATSTNSRSIFSRGVAPVPVYRTTLEWRQRAPNVVTGCFGRQDTDTRRLIQDDSDTDTLDRLTKFRFGGGDRDRGRGAKRNPPHKKKPRSSDKTERLRELTEKLKSPPAGRSDPVNSGGVNTSGSGSGSASVSECATAAPPSTPPAQPPQPSDDDLFECVNLKLPKPESRTIVGSYIQRTIPFRSASFSQVDFSSADGKYIRTGKSASINSKIPSLGSTNVSLTLPKKKTLDTSPTPSSIGSSSTAIDVTEGSTASLDSAVGSSEWLFPKPTGETHVKSPNLRSLTHPLTRRALSTEENISYSSIDGSGLRYLGVDRQLEGLREESEVDSAVPSDAGPLCANNTSLDNTIQCVLDVTVEQSKGKDLCLECPSNTEDNVVEIINDSIIKDSSNESIVNNVNTVKEENISHTDNEQSSVQQSDQNSQESDNVNDTLESSQTSIKTYVVKWPKENEESPGEVKSILTDLIHLKEVEIPSSVINSETDLDIIKLEENKTDNVTKSTHVESPTISSPMPNERVENTAKQRWSDDVNSEYWASNEWPSSAQEEPQSPDDGLVRPSWPRGGDRRWLERPRLICQSSEEREDETTSPRRFNPLVRNDSLSEGESDPGDRRARTASPNIFPPSDQSDTESKSHNTRRYSKRPLRGPYGQMLEAEMKKPEANRKFSKLQYNDELKFLENYSQPPTSTGKPLNNRARAADDCHLKRSYTSPDSPSLDSRTSPKRKVSANIPYSAPNPLTCASEDPPVVHIRTTSSPSKLEGCSTVTVKPHPSPQLLAQLLKGSSERACAPPISPSPSPSPTTINHYIAPHHWKDTRTHVVVELYDTERSYVESLQILVMKYLHPLKSPENAGLVDSDLVDEIFYQVPAILAHHEEFLEELKNRLEHWDVKQRVGDIFLETFTKQAVIDTYTAFINNWKNAKEAIKSTSQAKPAFARFLEAMAREHKGKLALDSLLIMPVQRIPRYELLIQTLLKHTEPSHPDHGPLCEAQREVHSLALRINCTERESLELEQLEALIEGGSALHLAASDRSFLRHDLVTMASSQGRKERALFLFSDLLIITSIKRRSGTIRKPSMNSPGSIASTLEANKYKLLTRIPLDDLEVVKEKDENVRRQLREIEHLREDVASLGQMTELASALHCPHSQLETDIRDMHSALTKQLAERQSSDSQLSYLELMLNTQNGVDNLSVIFSKPDKRSSWEETFTDAKQRLALSTDKRLTPEFVAPVPIRKTRAGLQFTCAAPTLGSRDVWVCNSDGYVGQVCVLSLSPEPTVTSCNGVCNARILCIAAIPASLSHMIPSERHQQLSLNSSISISVEDTDKTDLQLESSSSSSSEDEVEGVGESVGMEPNEDCDHLQPTMWLGTEDGCIHVYNSSDNIRFKKNKIKIQHGSSVHSIKYLDNRVFVALANGDICVYMRDSSGVWDTTHPFTVTVGTVASPVSRMVPISDRLWCSCHNIVKVLNISTLVIEHQFSASGETQRSISCLAVSGLSVWVSLQHSAVIRLFHATTYDYLAEFNVAPSVTKMLASCDDIIRQHKAACLRVTSLLACQELLWVGTSAGVILTLPLPLVTPSTTKISPSAALHVTGVPHGHTGHVRFLTAVESKSLRSHVRDTSGSGNARVLVISGGDGYEDFRSASISEVAGREDSTNHLLLWQT